MDPLQGAYTLGKIWWGMVKHEMKKDAAKDSPKDVKEKKKNSWPKCPRCESRSPGLCKDCGYGLRHWKSECRCCPGHRNERRNSQLTNQPLI